MWKLGTRGSSAALLRREFARDYSKSRNEMHESTSSFVLYLVSRRLVSRRLQTVEYGKVILPFTVLRGLNCVLASTKSAVLAEHRAEAPVGGPALKE
jgi:hypothetical protein